MLPTRLMFAGRWIRYHGRSLGAVLLGLCCFTLFVSLVPLYTGQVLEARAVQLIQSARPENLNITVTSSVPLSIDVMGLLSQNLGGIASSIRYYDRAIGPSPLPPNGMLCGYDYVAGETITPVTRFAAGISDHCYMVYSFGELEALFTLAAGRWPENLSAPDVRLTNVPTVMGEAQVEAVLTVTAANSAGIQLGDMLVVGNHIDRTVTVKIVGLLEPSLDPSDPFWNGRQIVLAGALRPFGSMETRFDLGLVVTEQAFQEWVDPIAEMRDYAWWLEVNPDQLNADWFAGISEQLFQLESQLRLVNPNIELLTGMKPFITAFADDVIRIERPAYWLTQITAVIGMLLLTLLAGLLLDHQRSEWDLIRHRGGGRWQLGIAYVLVVGILGLIAGFAGPFLALGLQSAGQQAGLLANPGASISGHISNDVMVASWIAAGLGVVALALPAWLVARRVLLDTQGRAYPPRPAPGRRFFLALILLLAGAVLVFRLYLLGASGLDDPFSLAGPLLLAGGLILIWLRVFPRLIWIIGRIVARLGDSLSFLAFWQIERDPAAYTSWVAMVIVTATLGMAATTFSATQEVNAWITARQQIGADVSIRLDSADSASSIDWGGLPGVTEVSQLAVVDGTWRTAALPLKLLGVDPATLADILPDQQEMLAALDAASSVQGGLALPDGTEQITMQVYSVARPVGETDVILELLLVNAIGAEESVMMSSPGSGASEQFTIFTASIPSTLLGQSWRLAGVRFLSEGNQVDFTHTVYIDDVTALDQQGRATLLEGFEQDSGLTWLPDVNQNPDSLIVSRNTTYAAEGAASLEVDYRIRNVQFTEIHPLLAVNPVLTSPIPILASEEVAVAISKRSADEEITGSISTFDFETAQGTITLPYRVVGVIASFPGTTAGDAFVVTLAEPLLRQFNVNRKTQALYSVNQVWLALADQQPDSALRTALAENPSVGGVSYASDWYTELRDAPLATIIALILYGGFGVAFVLCLMGSGYYFAGVARRYRLSAGILEAVGWTRQQAWRSPVWEQVILLLSAEVVGILLGGGLLALLLPFLTPVRGVLLALSFTGLFLLFFGILAGLLTVCLVGMSGFRQTPLAERLRVGDE
ncbi:MAG: hypothetical protein H6672_01940 [Anaerolineaceae bacterium]|nr:hypothetical protein [Anaerolineaceae bacterium]